MGDDSSRGDGSDIEQQWNRLRSKLMEIFKLNSNLKESTGQNEDDEVSLETGDTEVSMLDFEVYLGKKTDIDGNSNSKGIRWRRISMLSE